MLRNLFLFVPCLLLVHVTSAVALPPCKGDYTGPCYGTYTHANGDKYVGEYRDGKKHGQGTYTHANGDEYVGEWKGDNKHGQGTYTHASGHKYVGEYRDGKAHGQGTYTHDNGDEYVGEYRDGKKHGHGTYTHANGDKYVGEWKGDNKHGQGTYTFTDDSSFYLAGLPAAGLELVGEMVDGWANGNVTLYWDNGDVWVGRMRMSAENPEGTWLGGNKYTAGNVPPEVYASRGGDAPPTARRDSSRPDSDEIIPASSGSGFVISKSGHIVTNHHVIDHCNQVEIHHKGKTYTATVVDIDIVNDLAVLQVGFTPTTIFSISSENAQLLQDVFVAGYPFGNALSTSVKVTKGIVSSDRGIGNNISRMQIDAALQPGNSGGPILDEAGNVVGVAVAKLDLKVSLEEFGAVPDDTNFGIKSSVLKNFLDANGIETLKASTKSISRTELGKKITDETLFLSCLMTSAQIEKLRAEKVMFSDLE